MGARSGNTSRPLTSEQSDFAATHLGMARQIARGSPWRYHRSRAEDVEDVAVDAVITASRMHRPPRPSEPLLGWCVRNAWVDRIRREVGRAGHSFRRTRIESFSVIEAGGETLDLPSGEDPVGASLEAVDAVESLAARLNPYQRRVVLLRYRDAATRLQRVAAAFIGVTEPSFNEALHRAHRELRSILEREGVAK